MLIKLFSQCMWIHRGFRSNNLKVAAETSTFITCNNQTTQIELCNYPGVKDMILRVIVFIMILARRKNLYKNKNKTNSKV